MHAGIGPALRPPPALAGTAIGHCRACRGASAPWFGHMSVRGDRGDRSLAGLKRQQFTHSPQACARAFEHGGHSAEKAVYGAFTACRQARAHPKSKGRTIMFRTALALAAALISSSASAGLISNPSASR